MSGLGKYFTAWAVLNGGECREEPVQGVFVPGGRLTEGDMAGQLGEANRAGEFVTGTDGRLLRHGELMRPKAGGETPESWNV